MPRHDRGNYYLEYICTNSYKEKAFGFTSRTIVLVALGEDGVKNTGNILYSFDGINCHGVYRPDEGLPMEGKMRPSIWIKDEGNNDKVRIFAW